MHLFIDKYVNKLFCVFFALVFTAGCSLNKQIKDELPYIDVRKNYPEKEIILTEIANVTYLHLNSNNEEYLYKGNIRNVTNNTIVIYDNSSGSIMFFSKDGNPKSQFNHFGQGPEEYNFVERIIYDEENNDVFVFDNKLKDKISTILVYSSSGKYKRKIPLPHNAELSSLISFDDNSFFVNSRVSIDSLQEWDGVTELIPTSYFSTFYQVSKENGTVLDSLKMPCNITDLIYKVDRGDYSIVVEKIFFCNITKSFDGLFLCNPENDTIYHYAKDKAVTPVFYKTPPVQKTNLKVIIDNWCEIGDYLFFRIQTLQSDMRSKFDYPEAFYIHEKKTNEIFRQKIILPDYKDKEFTICPSNIRFSDVVSEVFFELDLIELKQAYNENKLSGKLKELVASLNELSDNNVFMFVRFN